MNGKEFAKAQASIMNKKTKLVQLKDDRAEACKKINEIEQEIAKTENELLEEENKFILLCGQKSQLMREACFAGWRRNRAGNQAAAAG